MVTATASVGLRELWDYAFRRAPVQARFLFGGYLLLAIAALVLASQVSLGSLGTTAAIVLASAAFVTLVVKALSRGDSSPAAGFVLWTVVVLAVAVFALFISSAFFGVPSRGSVLVARAFSLPELLVVKGGTDTGPLLSPENGAWPAAATVPLDVSGDRFDRLDALRKRPSLHLNAANPVRGGGVVFVNTLELKGEAIVTDGQDLTIEAIKIRSESGGLRSITPATGGGAVGPGSSGGRVTLIVHDRIVGRLTVDLSGSPGGIGADGRKGPDGAPGAPGSNSASSLFDCKRGPGRGLDGQPGQAGEDGQSGFPGGAGGTLVLAGPAPSILEAAVSRVLSGGAGGQGGRGGLGGSGGAGGAGGRSSGLCSGVGPSGSAGPRGADGKPGPAGPSGSEGAVALRTLNENGVLQ